VADAFVRISGTDGLDLRFRYGPGTEYVTIRIAEEGEVMRVSDGPQIADGLNWWRLHDAYGNIGWAAEEFLVPVAPPAAWNPPSASPTHSSDSGLNSGASTSP
jgi:hypothetical protein